MENIIQRTIYLVNAHIDYEGYSTICGFETLIAAEKFVQQCTEYDLNREKSPKYTDNIAIYSKELQNWKKNNTNWIKNHPASSDYSADYYEILAIELKT